MSCTFENRQHLINRVANRRTQLDIYSGSTVHRDKLQSIQILMNENDSLRRALRQAQNKTEWKAVMQLYRDIVQQIEADDSLDIAMENPFA